MCVCVCVCALSKLIYIYFFDKDDFSINKKILHQYAEELMLLNCGVGELRVPWAARMSKQSILREISPGYSLEGLMLRLKLQYFGPLMQRGDSFENTLMLGGIGGRKRRG